MRQSREQKLTNLLLDTYRELYANCTVPVSFDDLIKSSPKDEDGRIMIPYEMYFIDGKLYDDIVERNMHKIRMNSNERQRFRMSAYLGCGPTVLSSKNRIVENE